MCVKMVTGNNSVERGQRHATRWSKLSDSVLEQALDKSLEAKGTKGRNRQNNRSTRSGLTRMRVNWKL